MKKLLILSLALISVSGFAGPYQEAEKDAKDYLQVNFVNLESWSNKSYFFTTDLEYRDEDQAQDFPCIRGVVVNKKKRKDSRS